jgi:hypothetical protein
MRAAGEVKQNCGAEIQIIEAVLTEIFCRHFVFRRCKLKKAKKAKQKILSLIMGLALLAQSVHADRGNIDGGGGGMGQGTANNGWAVSSTDGRLIFDAEGLRVYLVNSSTGVPVSRSIDITNSNIVRTNIRNGRGKTKHEYKFVDGSLGNFDTEYRFVRVSTTPQRLPRIIPWNESSNTTRIAAIKEWFLNPYYADWVLFQLGTDISEVRAGGYFLAIEPIAYFRYNGLNYAMTATEAAIYDRAAGGGLRNNLGPLTHKNLPLAIFLETDEFIDSTHRANTWTGSRTNNAANSDIINQLGIGYIHYSPPGAATPADPGSTSFSYPTDTWVVTSFRLNNVLPTGSGWTDGGAITSRNPASVQIEINGTEYEITNIYIPPGGEQRVWVKWKTPSAPQEITATATAARGYLYNRRNTGVSDRYATTIIADIRITSNDIEREPPDPTLEDTPTSIGYSAARHAMARSGILNTYGMDTTAWQVWDCNWQLIDSELRSSVNNPADNYNPTTGIFTEYVAENSQIRVNRYNYRFNRINFRAEIGANVKMSPDTHNPTAYTRNYRQFMKSGYGVNLEVETFTQVTMTREGTGETTTDTHFSPTATSFVTTPQYVFASFPEFHYTTFNRQLEFVNNRFVFKKNRYSTYNSRVHYTPWWYPENADYDIITKIDFAYTPSGKLLGFAGSNVITIDGNLIDDWRIVKIR